MMNGTETPNKKKESLTIANFDFSDEIEDLNDLNFKIINEGLGFHHEDKTISKRSMPQTTLKPLSARNQTKPNLNTIEKNYISERPQELAAFYTPSASTNTAVSDSAVERQSFKTKESVVPSQKMNQPRTKQIQKKKLIAKKQVKAPLFLQFGKLK